jgi:pimeloyl-ACP methyl ester carboxylesterase
MERFSVAVGEVVLDDLRRRLDATRWPDEPPHAGPEHGFGLAAARELAAYWRDGYDWRAAEAVLNSFAEQRIVDGVHYFADGEGDGPPLVLLHGWPSSPWEFTRIVPLLREHARVIVPSLPGYAYSFTPGQARASIVDCADAIHGLLRTLGHERYLVAGGDWGSSVAVRLAHAYPEAVQALHLYMMPLRRPETWPESELGSRAALAAWTEEEGGYVHIQGTRPQTLAYGLADSPVGLMSWIAEKFDRWTDARGVSPDDVLTTTMIYWTTGCIGASFWPYWARRHGDWVLDDVAASGHRIAAPLTYLDFPKELIHVPRTVVAGVFDIERWETPGYGGHFPALETTEVLADSLVRFAGAAR